MSPARTVSSDPEFTSTTENFGASQAETRNRTFPGFAARATTLRMASGRFGNGMRMDRLYDKRSWRDRPRGECVLSWLGPCRGLMHWHHLHGHSSDEVVAVCARHHPMAEKLRRPQTEQTWRRCHHRHSTREGREACERRLNRTQAA